MSFRPSVKHFFKTTTFFVLLSLAACGGGNEKTNEFVLDGEGVFGPNVSGSPANFRGAGIINNKSFLIGGPLARGQEGDVLMVNNKVRFIIRKPDRMAGIQTYGGNIVDADLTRPAGEAGQDNFGFIYPLINIAWTTNYRKVEIINADFANGPIVVRATAALTVYDYIMTNIISHFVYVTKGVDLFYDDRYRDILNPFTNVKGLKDISRTIVTDYTLKQDSPYLIIETRLQNNGSEKVAMPLGDWVNASGPFELFSTSKTENKGFVYTSLLNETSGLVYGGIQTDIPVSYGYFYNPIPFFQEGKLHGAAAIYVSGVTIMVLGEGSLLDLLPIGGNQTTIDFEMRPGVTTITRYLTVGKGDVASALDAGLEALGVSRLTMSGKVTNSQGQPVDHAKVVVLDFNEDPSKQSPVTVAYSDAEGNFSAQVSTANDIKDQMFGSGKYTVDVYKEGYLQNGTQKAGQCSGGQLNSEEQTISGVTCKLGSSGNVAVKVNVDGEAGPAAIRIVGFDPSPIHPYQLPSDFAKYADPLYYERPYGITDILYIDPQGEIYPKGNPRINSDNSFRLEPGTYDIFVSRGMEYSVYSQKITVTPGNTININANIKKVLDTSGFVSGDFHVHGIDSPDAPMPRENRILSIMAEGLDVVAMTDHENVSDYSGLISSLGYQEYLKTFPGDEITPFAFGHFITWPLTPNPADRANGAYDYTYIPKTDDTLDPDRDLSQTMADIISGVDASNPGTQVLSIAHITDPLLGNFALSRLVTTSYFTDLEGIKPLSSFSDPVNFRLEANTNSDGSFLPPFPLGTSSMVTMDFTSVGLTIGTFKNTVPHLVETALPTYFNLLNLGKICSATSNSDAHYFSLNELVGEPRNFVESSIDPRDGLGSFTQLNPEDLAKNVNEGKFFVTNGVFIKTNLKTQDNSQNVGLGGTIKGSGDVTLELEISSNEFLDWDEVRIFANTIPIPAKDDLSGPTDLNASEFHTMTFSHLPRYIIDPTADYTKNGQGENKLTQSISNGVRKATITKNFNFTEDTWIVVLVTSSDKVVSTFPLGAKGVKIVEDKDVNAPTHYTKFVDTFENDRVKIGGTPVFGYTNPIFVDVDGNGFESIYIADGTSPLIEKQ